MRYIATVVMVLGLAWYPRSIARADDESGPAWLPVGEGWWCYSLSLTDDNGGFVASECMRTKQACATDLENTRSFAVKGSLKVDRSELHCTTSKKAVGFTYHSVVEDETFGRYYPRVKDCQLAHDRTGDADHDEVSGCGLVGDVEPNSFDVEMVPETKGWYCAMIRGAHVCQSRKEDCVKHVGDARADSAVATNCTAQPSAFALTTRGRLFVFGTQAMCIEHMQSFPEASSCKKI